MKLFVRDLTVIDCSYLHPRRGMVGQSWLVDLELHGALNTMGMVLDFGRVKKLVKTLIDDVVDHRLLVPRCCGGLRILEGQDDHLWIDFASEQGSIHLHCPNQGVALIDQEMIDAAGLTHHLEQVIRNQLPKNVQGVHLTLREEGIDGACYHYSHGLKKHDGNCQRIAHGHRSMIEITVDGVRNQVLEQQWAARWDDIYLGSEDDLVSADTLHLSEQGQEWVGGSHYCFSYRAPQGLFELAMPKGRVELIDSDTTIELLAGYIAYKIKPEVMGRTLVVRAFEGPGKGAIVTL